MSTRVFCDDDLRATSRHTRAVSNAQPRSRDVDIECAVKNLLRGV
jgi:hypothetical protein